MLRVDLYLNQKQQRWWNVNIVSKVKQTSEFERKRLKTGRLDDQQPKLRQDNFSSGVQRIHTTIDLNL